ncbi:hypothetical protein [Streptomyces rochei]
MRKCRACDTVNDFTERVCMVCDTPFPLSRVRINRTGRRRPRRALNAG